MSLLSRLSLFFKKHPLLSNVVVVGSLYAAGDVSQQTIRGVSQYNWHNTANITLISASMFGPIYHNWYRYLDTKFVGNSMSVVGKKMVCDQMLLSPVLLVIFFGGLKLLEGQPNKMATEIKQQAPKAFLTSCIFWPPIQLVNFRYIPGIYRTTYVAFAAFVWTNILCFLKSKTLLVVKEKETV